MPDCRTVACCARLCRAAGGELEQFNSLLDTFQCRPPSRYLGCTQRIASVVNDRIGIEPNESVKHRVRKSGRPSARILIDGRKGFVGTDLSNFRKTNCGRKHPRLTLRPAINYKCDFRHSPRRAQSL